MEYVWHSSHGVTPTDSNNRGSGQCQADVDFPHKADSQAKGQREMPQQGGESSMESRWRLSGRQIGGTGSPCCGAQPWLLNDDE